MATTTLYSILENYDAILFALSPTILGDVPFSLHKPTVTLEEWAEENGSSALLRHYEWVPGGVAEEPLIMSPDMVLRKENVTLKVAYPRENSRYNSTTQVGLGAVRNMMRLDARLLRDAIFSPDSYLSGHCSAIPIIEAPDETGVVFVQNINILLTYYEAQSL